MKYKIEYVTFIGDGIGGKVFIPSLIEEILGEPPTILIVEKYRNDIGLLNHELKHVEQYNREWFYYLRYNYVKSFRYRMELEAYTEQIKAYKYKSIGEVKWIINALLNKYNLKISEEKITYDIKNILINNLFDKNQ